MPDLPLEALPPAEWRAVVINVNTDVVTTLALTSLDRRLPEGTPVLLINCDPTPEGREHFAALQQVMPFDIVEAPVRHHGLTLDWLFRARAGDGAILLLDSDAELVRADFYTWMQAKLSHELAFGAGYTWGPFWVPPDWGAPEKTVLYAERPWFPCVLLKVDPVISALEHGLTFLESYVHNEFIFSNRVAHFLAARWGPPWGGHHRGFERLPASARRRLAAQRMDFLWWAARDHHGRRPKIACFDTGGAIYQWLINERGLLFAGIPIELAEDGVVNHFSGVSRHEVYHHDVLVTPEHTLADEVVSRLVGEYRAEEAAHLLDRLSASRPRPSRSS